MPRRYPVEFCREVLHLIAAGKPFAQIAAQLGITAQTVYIWRNHDQIDRGVRAGISTTESAELTAACKRIREFDRAPSPLGPAQAARHRDDAVQHAVNAIDGP